MSLYDEEDNPLTDREVLWVSHNGQVATVDEEGVVTARAPGRATITARAGEASASVDVHVSFDIERVAAGAGFGCAAAIDKVYCWDDQGVQEVSTETVRDLSLSGSRGCLVSTDRKVFCFDRGDWALQEVDSLSDIDAVSVGDDHVCALTQGGKLYCWGDNSSGQLGRSGSSSATPVAVNSDKVFISVAVGARHSCAIDSENDAWCWGANTRGQLGGYQGNDTATPVKVIGAYKFMRLTAGVDFTCGAHPSGPSLCWGAGTKGQLGNGQTVDRDVPTMLSAPGNTRFNVIVAGGDRACGLTSAGAAYCWGDGVLNPQKVLALAEFTELDTSDESACGRTAEQEIHCWGSGYLGFQEIVLLD